VLTIPQPPRAALMQRDLNLAEFINQAPLTKPVSRLLRDEANYSGAASLSARPKIELIFFPAWPRKRKLHAQVTAGALIAAIHPLAIKSARGESCM